MAVHQGIEQSRTAEQRAGSATTYSTNPAERRGSDIALTLTTIVESAACLMGTRQVSISLLDDQQPQGLHCVAGTGLSNRYAPMLNRLARVRVERGVSGTVVSTKRTLVIQDIETDARFRPYLAGAIGEGYKSIVYVPLIVNEDVLGVMTLYRPYKSDLTAQEDSALTALATQAALAIRNAQLVDAMGQRVHALDSLVTALRTQTHEFTNWLHGLGALLAMGEFDTAKAFVDELQSQRRTARLHVRDMAVAGVVPAFVQAQIRYAAEKDVFLKLDRRSNLDSLPIGVSLISFITVVGNLVRNAVEAVSDGQVEKPRVRLALLKSAKETRIVVSDNGLGPPSDDVLMLSSLGFSTKPLGMGIGLSLVVAETRRCGGAAWVDRDAKGWVRFTATFQVPTGGS